MSKLNINVIVLAPGFTFSTGAMAQSMSKDGCKAGREMIAAEYKGREKADRAELGAIYMPTQKMANEYARAFPH